MRKMCACVFVHAQGSKRVCAVLLFVASESSSELVIHVQAGAIACIVHDNTDSKELVTMSGTEDADEDISIPAVFVSRKVGALLHGARVALNATGELRDDEMMTNELITYDVLASPFRSLLSDSENLLPGEDATAQIQILLDAVEGTTTVLDKLGSTFSPDKRYCTSLDGPGCPTIKMQMDSIDSDELQFSGVGSQLPLDHSAPTNYQV